MYKQSNLELNLILLLFAVFPIFSFGQCFKTGADLSYTNQILKEGGIYKNEDGGEIDPFEYFANEGNKIVRLRLWHTPSNIIDHCGKPIQSGSLDDVLEAAKKVKANGMEFKLSIHYGDYFVDPSKQQMPQAWEGLNTSDLLDSISNYTQLVLNKLLQQNTLPDIVSIGNETTWGFIDATTTTNGFDWSIDADKFNSGLSAIDSFNEDNNTNILKAIHLTEDAVEWAVKEFQANGIDNYDIIGFSYYPFFSPNTDIEEVGVIVKNLIDEYGKEVMIFETGFAWSNGFSDNYSNFISGNGNVVSFPKTEIGQKDFLIKLVESVEENGGTAVIYWEPGWITSSMCDKWGQGSSYENVSMFDTENKALTSFDFFELCRSTNSIKELNSHLISIYPNPVDTNILFVKNAPFPFLWELVDVTGKAVLTGEIVAEENGDFSLEIKEEMNGIYFLVIKNNKETTRIVRKVVVE